MPHRHAAILHVRRAALACTVVACTPGDPASEPTATTTGPATTITTTAEPDDTDTPITTPTTTQTTTSTTSEPTTAEPPGACQDGTLDDTEACDDGNAINGDGCNNDCQPSATQLFEHRTDRRGFAGITTIATDADGIVIGGTRAGAGWIGRFDPELDEQWSQSVGAKYVRAIALTDGAIYAGGAITSDTDGRDLWVAKLAADATSVVWEDSVSGGEGDDWATQVAVVDGDVIVTGMAFATMLWTRRYAADGTPQWTNTFPIGPSYFNIFPIGSGMVVTPTHAVIGWNLDIQGTKQEQLVAYTLSGDESWTATLPDTVGGITGLALAPDGTLASSSGQDFELLTTRRLTDLGAIEWSSNDCVGSFARDVAVDSQGDIVVIGDGKVKGGTNIRLCKFANDGTLRWGKDIDGGAGNDNGYAVAIDATDRIIAGGQFYVDENSRDAWLAVFSP